MHYLLVRCLIFAIPKEANETLSLVHRFRKRCCLLLRNLTLAHSRLLNDAFCNRIWRSANDAETSNCFLTAVDRSLWVLYSDCPCLSQSAVAVYARD
ncbi:hypothetical protein BCV72DRAFT_320360 [Rhizopus microsporus var. microsporus]|uniref:Uncharacterized protein n=1 Tax=Rhizopus microsporus var. microsporus TaxID=86635 RepID=A0A1X0RBQ2_RHIZD|nr:hypothetical protein BCV72DRAFT_320360 [Rhizopus microsporus var. microsporus]